MAAALAGAMPIPARLAAALVLLALGGLPASADAATGANLVDAVSLGCSPDNFTSPDLRVTVQLDGQVLFQEYARQTQHPLFARALTLPEGRSGTLTVQVEEGEPGGFFGFGTTFIPCDAAPGHGDIFTTAWSGEARTILARGDSDRAAQVVLVVGPNMPPPAVVQVSAITPTQATVSWDSVPGATGYSLAAVEFGGVIRPLAAAAGNTTLDGLCDGQAYSFRILRQAGDWNVGTPTVTFTTANLAPAAPRILAANRSGAALELAWEEATPHDVGRYDIHAGGDAGFVPSAGNRIATANAVVRWREQSGTFAWNGSAGFVKVVAIDQGGLSAASPAFRLGDPRTAGTLRGSESCGALVAEPEPATSTTNPTTRASSTNPTVPVERPVFPPPDDAPSEFGEPEAAGFQPSQAFLLVAGALLATVVILAVVLVARR